MRRARIEDVEASEDGPAGGEGLLVIPGEVRRFVLAGNARLTLRSLATGARYSYRVRRAPAGDGPGRARGSLAKRPWFVSVLIGPDNDQSYQYLGNVWPGGIPKYEHGTKSGIGPTAPSAKAWNYFWTQVMIIGKMPPMLEVWHEGRCGRCAKALTVPESIASGMGPECRGKEI